MPGILPELHFQTRHCQKLIQFSGAFTVFLSSLASEQNLLSTATSLLLPAGCRDTDSSMRVRHWWTMARWWLHFRLKSLMMGVTSAVSLCHPHTTLLFYTLFGVLHNLTMWRGQKAFGEDCSAFKLLHFNCSCFVHCTCTGIHVTDPGAGP